MAARRCAISQFYQLPGVVKLEAERIIRVQMKAKLINLNLNAEHLQFVITPAVADCLVAVAF